jgi:cytochrome P450
VPQGRLNDIGKRAAMPVNVSKSLSADDKIRLSFRGRFWLENSLCTMIAQSFYDKVSSMNASTAKSIDHIPSTGHPPLVNEFRFLSDSLSFARQAYARCGPVSRGWWIFKPSIYLMSAEGNELVLFDREGRFSAKKGWERVLAGLFPRGLMLRDAEDHRWHRRLMLPAFRKDALARYFARMTPRIETAVAKWSTQPQMQFYPQIKHLTLAIAADVFLGAQLEKEIDSISDDFTDLVAASVAVVRLPYVGRTYARGLAGRARLAEFIRSRIPDRRAGNGQDLFTQLCHAEDEQGKKYGDEEIVDHLIFLMMAAHDTTTSAITTMMYALAKHPDWQERLRQEAKSLPEHAALDDLSAMTQCEWVFKEALRLYQPLPTIARRALVDIEVHGIKIPAGSAVSVFPILVHRSPLWWSNPDSFDPERFSAERAEHRRHPFAWAPFGGGAHMCLGLHFAEMQVKAVLLAVLRRFSWSVPSGYEAAYAYAPIAKPKDGLPIAISPINL